MRRTITGIAGLVGAALVLAGCAGGGAASPSAESTDAGFDQIEPITITLSDANVEGSASATALQAFAADIEEKTDGKVTFEFFWASSLTPFTEALSAVQSGVADMAFGSPAYFPEQLPVASWFAAVGSANQSDAWPLGFMQSMPAMVEQWTTNDDILAEFAKFDAYPLLQASGVQNEILCTKPVSTLEEASGTLMRTPGEPWLGEAQAMGMTQVSLAYAEVYEGMQRGLAECATSSAPSGFMPNGLWEIAKYFNPIGMSGTAGAFYIINKDKWDSFPPQVRKVILEAKPVYTSAYLEATLDGYARWAKEAPAIGVKFLDPSELRDVVAAHREKINDALVSKAPAGVSDPQTAYDTYLASLDKWLEAAEEDFGIPAEPLGDSQEEQVNTYLSVEDLDWGPFTERLQELATLTAK